MSEMSETTEMPVTSDATTSIDEGGPSDDGATAVAALAFEQGRRLAADPNICAVGFGSKLRGGAPCGTGGETLIFFVREKLSSRPAIEDRGSWIVPPRIAGVATDVVEIGALAAAAADRAPPTGNRGRRLSAPLIGGAATMGLGTATAGPGGYGTLAGLCFDVLTGAPLMLSNAHVWGTVVGAEVAQPVTATGLLGAAVSPALTGSPALMVQTRIPAALVAPLAFANSVAQTYAITGSSAADPLPVGQAATPVAATARTVSEQVRVTAPAAGLPPAGVRQSPTLSWSYQRLAGSSVTQSTASAARPVTALLTARRLFTNAPAYSGSQTINLYGEIIPAAGGAPATSGAHQPLALLYPLATEDKIIPRLLRPVVRQTVTLVTTSFQGFPAPARLGPAPLPAVAAVASAGVTFAVDAPLPGSFVTGAGLPGGTFALQLPSGNVRVFVPIGTQVILDINLTGIPGPLAAVAINSARDAVPATVTTAAGTGGRTLVTVSASEIVEVVLSNVSNGVLFGVTSKRGSPETAAPLAYAGSASAADLLPKGKWGASLFVQTTDSGVPESANIVETAIGAASLISDCTFDVS